jgi:putative ABC transport system permease protein
MSFGQLILTALQSIRLNWLRALLTLLGIVIGVGAVIVMTALGSGSQAEIQKRIASLGDNLLIVMGGNRQVGGVSFGAGSNTNLDREDAKYLQQTLRNMKGISPVVRAPGQLVGGIGNWFTQSQGVGADFVDIRSWTLDSGAFFTERDVQSAAPVAVLGATVAKQLFPDRDPVGEKIRIGKTPCTIVGVLGSKGAQTFGGDQDDVVFVPWTTAQLRMTGQKDVFQILVNAPDAASMPALQDEITTVLRRAHRLPPEAPDDFTIRNQTEVMSVMTETTRTLSLLLASVAAISLLVGGIGIMNMMLVAVTERTREIGLRIALGARPKDIRAQFLTESVTICVMGGAIGTAMGGLIAWGVAQFLGFAAVVDTTMVIVAVTFSAAVGVFFGFYPAMRASQLDPIEALRYG